MTNKNQTYLYIAWLVSVISTLGSLYFSEIQRFIPCEYCWYQRIFMYPLAIILGIGSFQSDYSVKKYALPLAIIGGCVSLYHYLLQKIPGLAEVKPCMNGVPCSGAYIDWLGFITIPFLALTAFTIIIILMIFIRSNENAESS